MQATAEEEISPMTLSGVQEWYVLIALTVLGLLWLAVWDFKDRK